MINHIRFIHQVTIILGVIGIIILGIILCKYFVFFLILFFSTNKNIEKLKTLE